MTHPLNKLEDLLGGLHIKEKIEGVSHPDVVYDQMGNKEVEVVTIISNEVFELLYSKTYKALKFAFAPMDGDIEITSNIIRQLQIINDHKKELEEVLKDLQNFVRLKQLV
jgi:hypothetical protein